MFMVEAVCELLVPLYVDTFEVQTKAQCFNRINEKIDFDAHQGPLSEHSYFR